MNSHPHLKQRKEAYLINEEEQEFDHKESESASDEGLLSPNSVSKPFFRMY